MRRGGLGLTIFLVLAFGSILWAQTASLGQIVFPTSGAPAAQPKFLRGVLLLHSFEYEDAREAFLEAEKLDSRFALAYWGEAMTYNHPLWRQQNREAGRTALARLAPTPEARLANAPTEKEKGFLRAVEALYGDGDKHSRDIAYAQAMRKLYERFPQDLEVTSFYALAVLGTTDGERDFRTYMRAAAILEPVFAANSQHPGAAHYLIHSYDDPVHAPLGLRAARAYSKIAPDAAHAQHMTSHIFLALGMWDDVVQANTTAISVANRGSLARGESRHACGHYNFWLEYGYLQQGRFEDARKVLAGCRAQAATAAQGASHAHPGFDPDNSAVGSFVQMRTRYLLDTEGWDAEVLGWTVDLGDAQVERLRYAIANGFAAARRGDLAKAREALREVEEANRLLVPEFDQRGLPAESWVRKAPQIEQEQLRALVLAGEGQGEQAFALLRRAAAEEASLPYAFGPPVVNKPSNELLGEILLQLQRPAEARAAFQAALDRAPRRALALLGLARAAARSGDPETAQRTFAELGDIWRNADAGLPELQEITRSLAELRAAREAERAPR